jgi:hypothetical protein|tara:strand:+ start:344 stop:526 length:183 start_codon:yes stop_codon:yes gene_type:complete
LVNSTFKPVTLQNKQREDQEEDIFSREENPQDEEEEKIEKKAEVPDNYASYIGDFQKFMN